MRIDGSLGEGGGQVLRTSLSLSLLTGEPLHIDHIRAARRPPGLGRQHLTAVRAAAEVSAAEVEGAAIGSRCVSFRPGPVRAGSYRFVTEGAGSTTLVLQTVLLPLLLADTASDLVLEGGTHNPYAPPFDFVERAFLPVLRRMGGRVEVGLERPGFYPAGAGRLGARIVPAASLAPLTLYERGPERARRARALVSDLPRHIAERELGTAAEQLDIPEGGLEVVEVERPAGPGNAILIEVECERVTEVFTGFGRKGVPAEEVAMGAAEEARRWLEAGVPVGPHLQDQLLLPLAVAGEGGFSTTEPTPHTRTNAEVIARFLGRGIRIEPEAGDSGRWRIGIER